MTTSSVLRSVHPVSALRSSSCVQTQFDETRNPAPWNLPTPTLHQFASTGEPQSHFPAPFASTSLNSMMPQLAFNKVAFDTPTALSQRQCQMMILETKQDSFQVSLDVQTAFKFADQKRKRNATASHRFHHVLRTLSTRSRVPSTISHCHILAAVKQSKNAWFLRHYPESRPPKTTFFARSSSRLITLMNWEVLIIDSTYKTNRYVMPLCIISTVTALNTSFYVAFTFLPSETCTKYLQMNVESISEVIQEHQSS
jgi:hypothetical protein